MEEIIIPRADQRLPSSRQLLRLAFAFYVAHGKVLFGIALIPLFFVIPMLFLGSQVSAVALAFGILSAVVFIFTRLALIAAVSAGGSPEGGAMGAFERGASLVMPFLFVNILALLAASGGFLIFVVPGIMLSLLFSMASYILFTEGHHGIAALVRSWQYTRGYWWGVFWRYLVFGLLTQAPFALVAFIARLALPEAAGNTIFTILSLLFNTLFVMPLSVIYGYRLYTELHAIRPELAPPTEAPGLFTATRVFIVVGVVALIGIVVLMAFLLGGKLQ